MIVSTRPLIDCCPVLPAAMEGRQLCQWDKDSCADAGFLKIDLLGLGMLSAVERCVEEIARTRGERVDLSRIPYDDADDLRRRSRWPTRWASSRSRAARRCSRCSARGRESLDDLTIQVAIVRPGPILGGAVNPYIARLPALREDPDFVVPYDHPSLEPVLRDTLGTIIFQDQVIEVAMAFAGFSPGEAEGLRRAMSRKRSAAAIEAYHQRFVEGAARTHGVDEETAERVYAMIVGFSGFGFPKAHGAAFGLLAYQSTWLRVHYGPEFLCALLNEQPMGFYASDTLAHEAQRRGIEMLPAGRQRERRWSARSTRRRASVRLGLGYVLGVRADEVAALVAAREEGGPFRSLADLASRAGAGRPALERLAWAGACDALAGRGASRATGRGAPRCGSSAWPRPGERVREGTQLALPLELPGAAGAAAARAVGVDGRRLRDDRADARPAPDGAAARASCRPARSRARDLRDDARTRRRCAIGGLVVARQRPGTAKGIVFLLLEDEFGTINLIVPPRRLRAPPADRALRAAAAARGPAGEAARSAGGAINVVRQGGSSRWWRPASRRSRTSSTLAERRAAAAAAEARRGARAAARPTASEPGGLPRRRPRGAELRVGAATMTATASSAGGSLRDRAARTGRLPRAMAHARLRRSPSSSSGSACCFVALSGGRAARCERLQSQSRGSRRRAIVAFVVVAARARRRRPGAP